ncbi:poly-gamma-glutamate synthesis protein (capsule biosynthesis protein) [Methanococcus maripaludis]|uniref:Poly-gamma-glutamate synthesis protein (Capsule biosynthesis protein) n=1 Tax=Methanococcus maripaludis TaxID=39152 RepID=A0A7J9S795_METMI|nr:CapA family protein [Methanococcus maripaludis]MBB6401734.1 poly-gamma-glutamate synthesis protein (capsule biosynthesis protein) [Methanococcus maripaludis]
MNLVIYAVGDIMLGEQPLCHGFGVKSKICKNGIEYLFGELKEIFPNGDIVFGNLEAPASNITEKSGIYTNYFRADPKKIQNLKNMGFNVLSIANNHIMEHGAISFKNTVEELKKNNILPVGLKNGFEVLNVKGLNVGFLGCSLINDFLDNHPYNNFTSENELIENVMVMREKVDLLIISIHWGQEYVPYPSKEQVELGRKLIELGGDIILGGHPHVLQGYEIYKGKPIFYSLGNLIFDHTYIKETQKTIVTKINLKIDNKKIIGTDVEVIPLISNPNDYSLSKAKENQKEEILHFLSDSRKILKDKSPMEYLEVLKTMGYLKTSEKCKKTARREMKLFFLKNFSKYPWELKKNIIKKQFFNLFGVKK